MSLLSYANKYMLDGRLFDAHKIYHYLLQFNDSFLPYKLGYELSEVMLKNHQDLTQDSFGFEVLHPSSCEFDPSYGRVIFVVTPCFNASEYIVQTIESVLSQEGDFFIDYFIKDGVSTDKTIECVYSIADKIANGCYKLKCKGISFRFECSRDEGMYDALAKAFKIGSVCEDPNVIQTYINADDLLAHDAFKIVTKVFSTTPTAWLTGQMHVIDWSGRCVNNVAFPMGFSSNDIAAGLHNGVDLYTVQQEGTFWLQNLYRNTSGFNSKLKLAGDFDLWVKFASHSELLAVDRHLGSFRVHENQLSRNKDMYREEVKSIYLISPDLNDQAINKTYLLNQKAPPLAGVQSPGPVCFLDNDGNVLEIAYIQRGWFSW